MEGDIYRDTSFETIPEGKLRFTKFCDGFICVAWVNHSCTTTWTKEAGVGNSGRRFVVRNVGEIGKYS